LALETADPAPVVEISASECPVCQRFASEADVLRTNEQHAGGAVWTVNNSLVESFDAAGPTVVIASIHQNPVPRLDKTGAVVSHYKDRTDDYAFTLVRDGEIWRTSRLQAVQ
jgi:hypothetical protein